MGRSIEDTVQPVVAGFVGGAVRRIRAKASADAPWARSTDPSWEPSRARRSGASRSHSSASAPFLPCAICTSRSSPCSSPCREPRKRGRRNSSGHRPAHPHGFAPRARFCVSLARHAYMNRYGVCERLSSLFPMPYRSIGCRSGAPVWGVVLSSVHTRGRALRPSGLACSPAYWWFGQRCASGRATSKTCLLVGKLPRELALPLRTFTL